VYKQIHNFVLVLSLSLSLSLSHTHTHTCLCTHTHVYTHLCTHSYTPMYTFTSHDCVQFWYLHCAMIVYVRVSFSTSGQCHLAEHEQGAHASSSGDPLAGAGPSFDDPLDPRRLHMITASRFGQAVGMCRYASPKHFWQLLTGRIIDSRPESSSCLHGQRTEAEARVLYSER